MSIANEIEYLPSVRKVNVIDGYCNLRVVESRRHWIYMESPYRAPRTRGILVCESLGVYGNCIGKGA
jgi:hypothetical protein